MPVPLLAQDVHMCVADGNAIFLDLRSDRYIGLDTVQTDILRKLIEREPPGADADALVAHLIAQNLFTQDARSGRVLELTEAPAPTAGLVGFEYDPPSEVRWHHVIALAASYIEVAASLRFRSLAATVASASKRRRAGSCRRESLDVGSVRALVLAFRRLRALFYRGREQCLLDSLVLASFLGKYGVFPRVVIGVVLGPFGGHCWVQHETLVLNDRLERVTKFTPIMAS